MLNEILHRQMTWLNIRQNLIAINIANADKPKFRPVDMHERAFKLSIDNKRLQLSTTNVRHITPGALASSSSYTTVGSQNGFLAKTYSGNSVSIEEQSQKVQRIAMEYKYATLMYSSIRRAVDLTLSLSNASKG